MTFWVPCWRTHDLLVIWRYTWPAGSLDGTYTNGWISTDISYALNQMPTFVHTLPSYEHFGNHPEDWFPSITSRIVTRSLVKLLPVASWTQICCLNNLLFIVVFTPLTFYFVHLDSIYENYTHENQSKNTVDKMAAIFLNVLNGIIQKQPPEAQTLSWFQQCCLRWHKRLSEMTKDWTITTFVSQCLALGTVYPALCGRGRFDVT